MCTREPFRALAPRPVSNCVFKVETDSYSSTARHVVALRVGLPRSVASLRVAICESCTSLFESHSYANRRSRIAAAAVAAFIGSGTTLALFQSVTLARACLTNAESLRPNREFRQNHRTPLRSLPLDRGE